MNNSFSKTTLFLSIGFVLLWNTGFIGAEYGLPYTKTFTLLFWRYLALSIILFIYLSLTKRIRWIGFSAMKYNMIIGILAHGIWLSCVLVALEYKVPAGIVALVVALQPMMTGAFSGKVTGERTSIYKWIGLIIGFCGVAVTVSSRIVLNDTESVLGYIIPLGSVIAITAATLFQRRTEITKGTTVIPIDLALFYQSLGTTIALAFPAILVENLSTRWELEFIYTMIWLVLGVSLGAYALMWLLLKRIDATKVASLFYLGPPVTMIMAWFAFGDILKSMDIIGLAVVFTGVFITHLKK